jgi:hypothetical protein
MAGKVIAENNAPEKTKVSPGHPPTFALVRLCVAAWLIPGLGHVLVGRRWRALILFASIMIMFALGLAMQGQIFSTNSASYLEVLGHYGELCVGVAMPAARFFGYGGGDTFFVSSDFGTAYLVAAGMLNVLAVLDCFDIAMGRKQ